MTLSTNLQEAFDKLELHYGDHSAAAKVLGYNLVHYRRLRNGRSPVPKRTADYILLKAQELSLPEAPPSPDYETEARL